MANSNQDEIDFGQNYTLSLSLFHLSVIIRKPECLKYLLEKNLSTDVWLEPVHFQTCIPPTAWSGHGSGITKRNFPTYVYANAYMVLVFLKGFTL